MPTFIISAIKIRFFQLFMCIADEFGFKKEHKFSTLTSDLLLLYGALLDLEVGYVAIENTGIYWIIIWWLLVAHFDIKLVNHLFIKHLPGRKTDVKDAHWISKRINEGFDLWQWCT